MLRFKGWEIFWKDSKHYGKAEDMDEDLIKTTYLPGVKFVDLHDLFPEFVTKTMEDGIKYFAKKLAGFDKNDAILVAPETRSSSPVRILRDDTFNASVKGIYPCGEGAGYAGGIMTSCMDGIRVARALVTKM